MKNQLKEWEIENYTRISAYDGRPSTGDDLSDILTGKYPDNITAGEIGCVTSHLKALKHFVEETDEPYAIIMEDDCDISIAHFWTFTWKQFISRMPYDWDTLQLAVICPGELHVQVHRRFINDFSTACYVITRHHAEKILRLHVRGSKYKLDNGVKPRAVSEDLILESGKTFTFPIFLYNIKFRSNIHQDHVNAFHRGSHDALTKFWEEHGPYIDVKDYMDYNPYLYRVSENS